MNGPPQPSCSAQSSQAVEDMAGTAASGVEHWLILEVRGVWERKVLDCPVLGGIRAQLEEWERDCSRLRLQLIRRPELHESEGDLRIFVARAVLDQSWILHGKLASMAEVAELSLPEILASGEDSSGCLRPYAGPLFLVCGHGRRDRCCAKLGTPVYNRLRELEPDATWQTSHTGGHRFAPTLVHLPAGRCYGRVRVEECEALRDAAGRGQVFDLDRLRGRCCLGSAAQAAEIHRLRHDASFSPTAAIEAEADDGVTTVQFERAGEAVDALRLRRQTQAGDGIEKSCSSGRLKPVQSWAVLD